MEPGFTPEEIADLRTLLEIERIKKVKLMYSHLMDSRDIDALIDIVAEDAVCHFGPYGTWTGRQEIYDGWKKVFENGVPYEGFHATTNMWVELTSPTTAIARTYLHDITNKAEPRPSQIVWYGTYDEEYRKIDGHWKLQVCSLQFLWPQRLVSDDYPVRMTPKALY